MLVANGCGEVLFIQDLMINSESPIIDLYPQDFDTDMNGKKQEWEAIVKIKFIDQDRLLKAMRGQFDFDRFLPTKLMTDAVTTVPCFQHMSTSCLTKSKAGINLVQAGSLNMILKPRSHILLRCQGSSPICTIAERRCRHMTFLP